MSDIAFDLIQPRLQKANGRTFWIADENLTDAQLAVNTSITVICNRIDLHQELKAQGWHSLYSDFDFSHVADNSVDQLVYRVSKEKPVVHHIINQAFRVLKPGASLVISGEKGEGIKSYIDKAKKLFDGHVQADKANQNFWLAEFHKLGEEGPQLDDKNYPRLREIKKADTLHFMSKPGLFGWDKIDQGSRFLIEQLPQLLAEKPTSFERALDLGCGYGYLSCHIASICQQLVATDNNCAAIACCSENLKQHKPSAQIIAANCAEGIEGKFDLIVCNPPFHSGFNVENSLTDRFLAVSARKLARHGTACFVVNQHIPLERKAATYFKTVETCADNGSFKLIRLSDPVQ